MNIRFYALPAVAALAVAAGSAAQTQPSGAAGSPSEPPAATATSAPLPGAGAAADAADTGILTSGTVVSANGGALVLRTDDHHHQMRFDLGSAASGASLHRGDHVSVRYHATGATGQAVDEVRPLDRGASPVNQASFRPVIGSESDVHRASSMDDHVTASGQGVRSGQTADRERTEATSSRTDASASRRDDADAHAARTGSELPATASSLPATAAAGLLLLVAGLAVGLRRRTA